MTRLVFNIANKFKRSPGNVNIFEKYSFNKVNAPTGSMLWLSPWPSHCTISYQPPSYIRHSEMSHRRILSSQKL